MALISQYSRPKKKKSKLQFRRTSVNHKNISKQKKNIKNKKTRRIRIGGGYSSAFLIGKLQNFSIIHGICGLIIIPAPIQLEKSKKQTSPANDTK